MPRSPQLRHLEDLVFGEILLLINSIRWRIRLFYNNFENFKIQLSVIDRTI
jgi:hypothetical protein